jgi:bidirectional [NiFe] hydrogenase diaphorase subunit
MACTVIIEGKEIRAKEKSNLLYAALDNGIYIPNLCSIRSNPRPFTSCRLCFVEIPDRPGPVTACSEPIFDGMKVTLESPRIRRLRKSSFDLLVSNHRLDCPHCGKNGKCDLQKIARSQHYNLGNRALRKIDFDILVDSSHPLFSLDRNKCVLCGKCIWVCRQNGSGVLDFTYRGIRTVVSTFAGIPLAETECNSCLECVAICPVNALYLNKSIMKANHV